MCWLSDLLGKLKPKPEIRSVMSVPLAAVKAELEELGIEYMMKDKYVADHLLYHTDEAVWQEIVPLISRRGYHYAGAPEVPDCDDYAKRASVEAAFRFHLDCFEAWGDSPYGRHAFNLVRVGEKEYRIFEPNKAFREAGRLMKLGESGYKPDSWRI
jgi:hypothetical protein